MSAVIRQIVARTWKEHIGVPQEWSTEQTEEFFTAEATRMADRISRMQAEQQLVVIRQWRHAHNGDQPDYLTQVGLINTARSQAEEIVLSQELYEQIPEDSENSEEEDELQAAWEAQVEREQWFRRLPEGDEPWKVAARANHRRLFEREGVSSIGELAVVGTEADVDKQLRHYADVGVTELWPAVFPVGDGGDGRTRSFLAGL